MNKESKYNLNDTKYEVESATEIAPDTVLLKLKGRLDFKPGQFVEARLDHIGSTPLAPCSDPRNKKMFELCVKAVGNSTSQIAKLLPGDFLNVRGPYGNHWQYENFFKTDLVIITGGLGIAPLRPLLLDLEAKKILLTKVTLVAGFRSPENILFNEDLKRWKKKFKVEIVVDFSHQKFDGHIGLVTDPLQNIRLDNEKTIVLACGPEPMYLPCAEILKKKKILEKHIFVSLERRMECGIGLCQHCSCGSNLVCQDGPIFRLDKILKELGK